MAGMLSQFIFTSGRPIRARVFSIKTAITSISSANSASSFWPSSILPKIEPANAPMMPAAANISAHDHTHGAAAGMVRQIDRGVGGDRDRAGADRDMGIGHADHIDHQRHREDRSAAADQAQRKSDQRSRCQSEHALHRGDHQERSTSLARRILEGISRESLWRRYKKSN